MTGNQPRTQTLSVSEIPASSAKCSLNIWKNERYMQRLFSFWKCNIKKDISFHNGNNQFSETLETILNHPKNKELNPFCTGDKYFEPIQLKVFLKMGTTKFPKSFSKAKSGKKK